MLTTLEIAIVTIVSVGGALFSAVLGWLGSGEAFDPRKFTSSVMRAIVAGVVFAVVSYAGGDITILNGWLYLLAFLGGMGIDSGGNRLSGAIAVRKT